jgi:glucose-1-phosphate thymidylyltransferase
MAKTLGIILAAGRSSRLYPATLIATKQILPIYDKPLIYYPLSTLMLAGIREFLIITNPSEKAVFENLFQNAEENLGIKIHFAVQDVPRGIADAFRVAISCKQIHITDYDRIALILGDNIFYGASLSGLLQAAAADDNAMVFATPVNDPERFGVVEMDSNQNALSIEEKPEKPKSNLAVTGLYFYPADVFGKAYNLRPSARGELEITDLNKKYLKEGNLKVCKLLRGMVWFDTGTPDSMMEASQFIQTLQNRQNILIGSPQEVAFNNEWITKEAVLEFASKCKNNYGKYLKELSQ